MEKYLFEVEEFFDWLELLTDENTILLGAKILEDKAKNYSFVKSDIGIDTMYYIEGFDGSLIPSVGFSIYGRSKGPNVPTHYYILYYRTCNVLNKNTILKFKRLYLYENPKKHS
jgi:hypothetical protein